MSLETYLRAAPKAELHVHLEGTIRPETVLRLARRHAIPLPADDIAGLRRWYAFRDFRHFIEVYVTITRCLRTVEDYAGIVVEYATELAEQNARYAEITFSPSTHGVTLGVPDHVFLTGLRTGRERALDLGVEINWIFDIVRDAKDPERSYGYTTRLAIERRDEGVIGIGLAGLETGGSAAPYVRWFDMAREAGLHCVPHAGEVTGPANVRAALGELRAERIAHGVRAVEDPALVAELAARRVPLDVCPTSNIRLGVYPALDAHPLRRLYDAGVIVTVGSDDPALFDTSLSAEVMTLATTFGFDGQQIDEVLLNAVRASFLPEARKRALLEMFRTELASLARVHLPPG